MECINELFFDLSDYSKETIDNPTTKREIEISEIVKIVVKSELSFDPFMIQFFLSDKEKKQWKSIVVPCFIRTSQESIDELTKKVKKEFRS